MDELLDQIGVLAKARYPVLYLISYEERRVERGLRRLCERESWGLWRWSASDGLVDAGGEPRPGSTGPAAALASAREIEEPALLVFYDLHAHLEDPLVARRLRALAAEVGPRRQAVVIVSPVLQVPRTLIKDLTILDVPLPSRGEIARLLRVLVKRQGASLGEELFERYVEASLGLTEEEVKRAYARISIAGGGFTQDDLVALMDVKAQAIRRTQFLEFYDRVEDMGDVGGLENLKEWLGRRAVAFRAEARAYGLPEPKGVFLLGVQGCGKSLTAKAVSSLFSLPLLRLDAGAVFQSVGGVESGLRETIRVAESLSPCVLWIDELEKGFATADASGQQALGVFLTWMQEKTSPVFVVATANEVRALPPELLRKGRFDEIFFVDLPDVHERLQILDIHLRRRGRDPDAFDLPSCAEETEKYSGAELEMAVIEAMFNAFSEDRPLNHRDLIRVIRETVPLAVTMDDRLKELREWARPRTRPASINRRRIDFFEDFQEVDG